MKILIFDFWYILFIKIYRRVLKNSFLLKRVKDIDSAMIKGANYLFLLTSIPLLSLFFPFLSDHIASKITGITFIVGLLVLLNFRYKKMNNWKLIEIEIDKKYSKQRRDRIFTILFIFYFVLLNLIFYWSINFISNKFGYK